MLQGCPSRPRPARSASPAPSPDRVSEVCQAASHIMATWGRGGLICKRDLAPALLDTPLHNFVPWLSSQADCPSYTDMSGLARLLRRYVEDGQREAGCRPATRAARAGGSPSPSRGCVQRGRGASSSRSPSPKGSFVGWRSTGAETAAPLSGGRLPCEGCEDSLIGRDADTLGKTGYSDYRYEGSHNEDGLAHGHGVLYLPRGEVFSGEFFDGMKHGHGLHQWPDGSEETGMYMEGKKSGWHSWLWGAERWAIRYVQGSAVDMREQAVY